VCVLKKNLSNAFFSCRAQGETVETVALLYMCSRINKVREYTELKLYTERKKMY